MDLSVSAAVKLARDTLTSNPDLINMTVTGEVSSFKLYSSGHAYFTLKDERTSVSCVMFSSVVNRYEQLPEQGAQITVRCRVDLYLQRGQFQFQVLSWQPAGAGRLYEQFLKMRDYYQKAGYFAQENKQELPTIVEKIGVITSPKGAVIHDIVRTARQLCAEIDIQLYPVTVQGETTAREVVAGLDFFNRNREVDVIIIARGGGSIEDLWPYNDSLIVESAFRSVIPIVSAIGHESDHHLLDYVADYSVATPTMAAQLCWQKNAYYRSYLEEIDNKLQQIILRQLRMEQQHLDLLLSHSIIENPRGVFSEYGRQCTEMMANLDRNMNTYLAGLHSQVEHLHICLENLNPRSILKRGYATICDFSGKFIQSSREWQNKLNGKEFLIEWQDGKVKLSNYQSEIIGENSGKV